MDRRCMTGTVGSVACHFFVSSSATPNVPLDFNGKSFSIKLGLLRKRTFSIINNPVQKQQRERQNLINRSGQENYEEAKYIVDTTREGWFQDDPSGYRDPWDFANDDLERQYIQPVVTKRNSQVNNTNIKRRRI
jgi:hypothetical protein